MSLRHWNGIVALLFFWLTRLPVSAAADEFQTGVEAYRAGNFVRAAEVFREAAEARPSVGALQNLGNAEWQRGRAGNAILSWEQALWINPFDRNSKNNLRYARATAQLDAPDLTWYETASTWLPMSAWAWSAAAALWLAVGMLILPGVFRWRKAAWPQAVAASALGIFLLAVTAQIGGMTRSRLGFVLEKDAPLRLTPTAEAEVIAHLSAGEAAREVRRRGNYVFIRASHATGWVNRNQFGLIGRR